MSSSSSSSSTRALAPLAPPPMTPDVAQAPRAIVLRVGAQTIQLPVAEVAAKLGGLLGALTAWRGQASGVELAVYTAFAGALRVGMPLAHAFVGASAGLLPPLPPRPRRMDPVDYLLAYLTTALPYTLARGEWVLSVDPASQNVTRLDWTGIPASVTVTEEPTATKEANA